MSDTLNGAIKVAREIIGQSVTTDDVKSWQLRKVTAFQRIAALAIVETPTISSLQKSARKEIKVKLGQLVNADNVRFSQCWKCVTEFQGFAGDDYNHKISRADLLEDWTSAEEKKISLNFIYHLVHTPKVKSDYDKAKDALEKLFGDNESLSALIAHGVSLLDSDTRVLLFTHFEEEYPTPATA